MLAMEAPHHPRLSAVVLLALSLALSLLDTLSPALQPPALRHPAPAAAAPHPLLDAVLSRYGSRLTAATWGSGGAAPPIFFLTAARAWGGGGRLQAAREEQYATNIGNLLSLGFPVYVSVSPGPPPAGGSGAAAAPPAFPLLDELAAAAPPGQLRVHYCSQDTAVRRRSGGADELLCMQEALPALLAGCVLPVEPFSPLSPVPAGCPSPDTHVIRMSGRYLMAKYDVLQAVRARGASVDAFFKWHTNWTETNPIARTLDPAWQPMSVRQVMTFMLSMKVRAEQGTQPPPPLLPLPLTRSPPLRLRTFSPPPPFPTAAQLRHFIQCHMMDMGVSGGWDSASRSVWRFAIEKLTADCILALPTAEALPSLGVLGNVGNAEQFEFF